MLALTGCRRNEIAALRWDDVDLAGRYIHHVDTALVAAADRLAARIAAAMDGREAGAQIVPLRVGN